MEELDPATTITRHFDNGASCFSLDSTTASYQEALLPCRHTGQLTRTSTLFEPSPTTQADREQAVRQAKQSFRNAQIAMGLGFTLLIAFAVVALNAASAAGSLVAGGLGAVSAGLAGYVSRTFIRSQEAAAVHLRAYFDQPLAFSRYLAAERLMADAGLSDEKHAEILSALVQAMVVGTAGPVPASTTEEQPPTAS